MSEGVQILITERGGQLVAQRMDQLEKGLGKVGATGARTMGQMRSLGRGFGELTSVAQRFSLAIAGGLGAAALYGKMKSFAENVTDIGVRANLTAEGMKDLGDKATAAASAFRTTQDEWAAGLREALSTSEDYGNSLRFNVEAARQLGEVSKAIGMTPGATMKLATVAHERYGVGPGQIKDTLAQTYKTAGKSGIDFSAPGVAERFGEGLRKVSRKFSGPGGLRQAVGMLAGAQKHGEMEQAVMALNTMSMHGAAFEALPGIGKGNLFKDMPTTFLAIARRAGGDANIIGHALGGRNPLTNLIAKGYDKKTRRWKKDAEFPSFFRTDGGADDIDRMLKTREAGPAAPFKQIDRTKAALEREAEKVGIGALGLAAKHPVAAVATAGVALAARKALAAAASTVAKRASPFAIGGTIGSWLGGLLEDTSRPALALSKKEKTSRLVASRSALAENLQSEAARFRRMGMDPQTSMKELERVARTHEGAAVFKAMKDLLEKQLGVLKRIEGKAPVKLKSGGIDQPQVHRGGPP